MMHTIKGTDLRLFRIYTSQEILSIFQEIGYIFQEVLYIYKEILYAYRKNSNGHRTSTYVIQIKDKTQNKSSVYNNSSK